MSQVRKVLIQLITLLSNSTDKALLLCFLGHTVTCIKSQVQYYVLCSIVIVICNIVRYLNYRGIIMGIQIIGFVFPNQWKTYAMVLGITRGGTGRMLDDFTLPVLFFSNTYIKEEAFLISDTSPNPPHPHPASPSFSSIVVYTSIKFLLCHVSTIQLNSQQCIDL